MNPEVERHLVRVAFPHNQEAEPGEDWVPAFVAATAWMREHLEGASELLLYAVQLETFGGFEYLTLYISDPTGKLAESSP